MKAVFLKARGGPESLMLADAPTPAPGSGEVLVRVHAAAVTPTELDWVPTWTTRDGGARPLPVIPGHEFSGEVLATGAGADGVRIGDAVFGMNDWFGDGTHAEFCVARAVDVAIKPEMLDHRLAATVPISALTAWQGLMERAALAPGERVLVHGAAGGAGLFAVQIARWRGAHVSGTASTHNLEFVQWLGAEQAIDYRARRFEDVAGSVDVVFDTVGGDTLARSWGVLRPGGRMVTIAASAERASEPRVRDAFFIVEPSREQLGRIARMIEANLLRPVADSVFPLASARLAYERHPVRGKVVLDMTA